MEYHFYDKFAIKKIYDTSETFISWVMRACTGGIEHVIDLNWGDPYKYEGLHDKNRMRIAKKLKAILKHLKQNMRKIVWERLKNRALKNYEINDMNELASSIKCELNFYERSEISH